MQIHEITKQQLEEGILGDLKKEVTSQATAAYTQAKQGYADVKKGAKDLVKTVQANPKLAVSQAGEKIKQGAQNAFQKYATPAGQLQRQNDQNAASAAKSANKLAMQFGVPLYQKFASQAAVTKPNPARGAQQAQAQAPQAQAAQNQAPQNKPYSAKTQQEIDAQSKAMAQVKEAAPPVQAGSLSKRAASRNAGITPVSADQEPAQTQERSSDPFIISVNKFINDNIGNIDDIEQTAPYGEEIKKAMTSAVEAQTKNRQADLKQALTYAFGVAKLAAMKIKKDAEGGSRGGEQTPSGRGRVATDDRSIQQAADAIKKVMGNTKVRQTSDQALNKVLNAAGVLGEGKQ